MKRFLCNVQGRDWEQPIEAETAGRAKAEYLREIHESWPGVPYTMITARELHGPPADKEAELQRQCDVWNAERPVGTTVDYHPVIGEPRCRRTRTTTAAYVLSGHTAVIHVEGQAGCVALDAITL